VVSADHGCGAHSETDVEPVPLERLPEPILDETGAEAVALPPREPSGEPPREPDPHGSGDSASAPSSAPSGEE
jgi:hypothetical protein